MYAVIATGGKQYRVAPGETIHVEKLSDAAGAEPLPSGGAVTFSEVLLVSDGAVVKVGQPRLAGATVSAEVVKQGRGEKLIIFKYRRRKGYRRKTGHRQPFTAVKITAINA
jgi:large subunit ribosomal protein L21